MLLTDASPIQTPCKLLYFQMWSSRPDHVAYTPCINMLFLDTDHISTPAVNGVLDAVFKQN